MAIGDSTGFRAYQLRRLLLLASFDLFYVGVQQRRKPELQRNLNSTKVHRRWLVVCGMVMSIMSVELNEGEGEHQFR